MIEKHQACRGWTQAMFSGGLGLSHPSGPWRRGPLVLLYRTGLLLTLLLACAGAARAEVLRLYQDAPAPLAGIQSQSADNGTIIRQRLVQVAPGALQSLRAGLDAVASASGAGGGFELELFDGEIIELVQQSVRPGFERGTTWVGEVAGEPESEVVLVTIGNILQANISRPGQRFTLRYVGLDASQRELHAIQEIDLRAYPPADPPAGPARAPQPAGQLAAPSSDLGGTNADTGDNIDVMVVYTPSARSAAGGTSAINAIIELSIAEINIGYLNSGIDLTMTLVHTQQVDYTESASIPFYDDLDAITKTDDGKIDGIHALRDTHGADLVSLLINEGSFCGLAWYFEDWDVDGDYGFQVTYWDCAADAYGLAHEFGHNQGADHDWDASDEPGYGHGYLNFVYDWATIMAYEDNNGCPGRYCMQINRWSNPNFSYLGQPTGIAAGQPGAADNARKLRETAYAVANYRESIPAPEPEPDPDPFPTTGFSYRPLVPCRLADSRIDAVGGAFGVGVTRTYPVLPQAVDLSSYGGSASGCNIPADAAAVHVSFTVVSPGHTGYLRAWPSHKSEPNSSVLTWAAGTTASNGINVPICSVATSIFACPDNLAVRVHSTGPLHLVIDLFGYYR